MVLLVGTLNFAIRRNIHVTEIYVCRPAAMLCDSQKRAATPRTCDVCLYDHSKVADPRVKLYTVLLEGVYLPLPLCVINRVRIGPERIGTAFGLIRVNVVPVETAALN
jgi:hypothetical protein